MLLVRSWGASGTVVDVLAQEQEEGGLVEDLEGEPNMAGGRKAECCGTEKLMLEKFTF